MDQMDKNANTIVKKNQRVAKGSALSVSVKKHRHNLMGPYVTYNMNITDLKDIIRPRYIQRPYGLKPKDVDDILSQAFILNSTGCQALTLEVGFPVYKNHKQYLDLTHEDEKARKAFNLNDFHAITKKMANNQVFVLDGQQRVSAFKSYAIWTTRQFMKYHVNSSLQHLIKNIKNLSDGISFTWYENNQEIKHIGFNNDDIRALLLSSKSLLAEWLKQLEMTNQQKKQLVKDINQLQKTFEDHVYPYKIKHKKYKVILKHYGYESYVYFNPRKIQFRCSIGKTPRRLWNIIYSQINEKGSPLTGYQNQDCDWEQYGLKIGHHQDRVTGCDIGDDLIKKVKLYLHRKAHTGPKDALLKSQGTLPNTHNNRIINLGCLCRALGEIMYNRLWALNAGKPSDKTFALLGLGGLKIIVKDPICKITDVNGESIYNKITNHNTQIGAMDLANLKFEGIMHLIEVIDTLNKFFVSKLGEHGSVMQKKTSHKSSYNELRLNKKQLLSYIADLYNCKRGKYSKSLLGIFIDYLTEKKTRYWTGSADAKLTKIIMGKSTYKNQEKNPKKIINQIKLVLHSSYHNIHSKLESHPKNRRKATSNKYINTLARCFANQNNLYECNGTDINGYDLEHLFPYSEAIRYGTHIKYYHLGNLIPLGSLFNKAKGSLTIFEAYKKSDKLSPNSIRGVNFKELLKRSHYFVKTDAMDYTQSPHANRLQDQDIKRELAHGKYKTINQVTDARENLILEDIVKPLCDALSRNAK